MIDIAFGVALVACLTLYLWMTIVAVIEAFTYEDRVMMICGIASTVIVVTLIVAAVVMNFV